MWARPSERERELSREEPAGARGNAGGTAADCGAGKMVVMESVGRVCGERQVSGPDPNRCFTSRQDSALRNPQQTLAKGPFAT
jgi:hypothetical protein